MANYELSDGVTFEEQSGPIYDSFVKSQFTFNGGFVKLQPYNQFLPRCFLKYQKRIKEFETKPDDIWVASFPKCGRHILINVYIVRLLTSCSLFIDVLGTTWTQEMVWCIMNNYDYEAAKLATLDERIPYFE
jgi:hypothetical protein